MLLEIFYLQIFPEFLRRLQTISEDKYHPRARQELLEALALSVANNPATLKHWQQMYLTYLPASAELLEYLGKFLFLLASDSNRIKNYCQRPILG